MFQQVHNIMADVPPENIVAMHDAVREVNQGRGHKRQFAVRGIEPIARDQVTVDESPSPESIAACATGSGRLMIKDWGWMATSSPCIPFHAFRELVY